jgi:hypothetical protein
MTNIKKINNTIVLSKRKIRDGVNPLFVAKGFTTLAMMTKTASRSYMTQ